MMSNDVNRALAQAFELIEANRQNEARNLLEPLLATERNNPDVWWMYAHAVADPVQAQQALQNVVRISPAYPGATTMLQQTEEQLPAAQGVKTRPQSLAARHAGDDSDMDDEFVFEDEDDDLDFDLDDFDDEGDLEETLSRRRSLMPILLTLILVVVLVIVFVVLNPFGDDDDAAGTGGDQTPIANVDSTAPPQITSGAQGATEDPTEPGETPELATEAPAPSEEAMPDGDDYSAFYNALAPLSVVADSASIETTAFGQTLLFDICTVPGAAFRDTLDLTMETLASQSSSLADDVGGIGARFLDCEAGQALNVLAVSSDDAVAFSDGLIDFDQYRSRWQPIG